MKRFIQLEQDLIKTNSFRGRLKEGLLRCKVESRSYHECVTINHLETQEKECEQQFQALKACLNL